MISGKILKKATAVAVAAMMVVMSAVPAFADDIDSSQETTQGGYTYTAPEKPMTVNKNIITATAHRAASPILGMMGVNAVAGFGMINGTAPTTLEKAQECAALGMWGSSINSSPDPYYWNYFYNFYADKNGLEKSDDALMNPSVKASPAQADTTKLAEYGNVSVSLSKRPDVVVGCSKESFGSDTSGYDDQLATIRSFTPDSEYYQNGDENYDPQLVSYQMTTIKDMIATVHSLADAITEVEKKTNKTTRYGNVQNIASDYEDYVYGVISYVREELAAKGLGQKTVAVVTEINGDDTYDIADDGSQSATSMVRAYEYSMTVTKNLCEEYGTKVTKDQLLQADAIITINNEDISQDVLTDSFGDSDYKGVIISNTPASMYGMTMNSVENAMGYAYVIGSLYSDVIDIDPVELCAYFYEHLCHITDRDGLGKVVQTNFAGTILPAGITAKLSDNYSSSKIANQLKKGKSYYKTYRSEFEDEECAFIGLDNWDTDAKTSSIGSGSIGNFYSISTAASEGGKVSTNLTNTVEGATVIVTATPDNGYTVSGVTVKDAAGNDIAVTKNSDGTYSFTMPAKAVTVSATFAKADAVQMSFTDVAAGSWYYDAVKYAVENNIMSGVSADKFDPNAKLTRSMLAQILYNHAGKPDAAASSMKDVASGSWYAKAVGWAAQKGIVTGYSDGTFKPTDSITREQLALMLYRYAGSPAVTGTLDNFSDASSVSAYAQDAVKWATANGIITGNGNATILDPKGNASRAQVAAMMMRYLENSKTA